MQNAETLEKLRKEINEQNLKMSRADKDIKAGIRTIKQRGVHCDEFMDLFERDLDLRELEYRNTKALNQLVDMGENDDAIGLKIKRMLLDKGLKLPHHLPRTRSFASWRSNLSEMSYGSRGKCLLIMSIYHFYI